MKAIFAFFAVAFACTWQCAIGAAAPLIYVHPETPLCRAASDGQGVDECEVDLEVEVSGAAVKHQSLRLTCTLDLELMHMLDRSVSMLEVRREIPIPLTRGDGSADARLKVSVRDSIKPVMAITQIDVDCAKKTSE